MKGKVIKYFPDKGFGFIKLENGYDCYFHKSRFVEEIGHIYPGDFAEVECRESRKKPGSYEASSIRIVEKPQRKNLYPENTKMETVVRGIVFRSRDDENFGFIRTQNFGEIYFSYKSEIIGQTFPEVDTKVLVTIIPSEVKHGSFQARTIRKLSNHHLGDFIPEDNSQIDDRNFKVVVYLLTQADRDELISFDTDTLNRFFNCLTFDQKSDLFEKWLKGDFDYFDERYLNEIISSLNAYDHLRAISRSQNIDYDNAFDHLREDEKKQLLNNAIEGRTTYFSKDYLRSKFPELTFATLIECLKNEDNLVRNELFLEYLEQFPPKYYSDSELKIAVNSIKHLKSSKPDKPSNIYKAFSKSEFTIKQKSYLFGNWLHEDFEYLDQEYLAETIDSLDAYDHLKAISRSQKIEYDSAFDQLNEYEREQLLHRLLLGEATFVPRNYLRSQFSRFTFGTLIEYLKKEDQPTKNELYIEYLELCLPKELNDSELAIVMKTLNSLDSIDPLRSKNLFTAIFAGLRKSQKRLLLRAFTNGHFKLFDREFLISEIKSYDTQSLLWIASKVDEQTATNIIEEMTDRFFDDQSNVSVSNIIQLFIDIREFVPKYPTLDLLNRVKDFLSLEDQFELWLHKLIDSIDEELVLSQADISKSDYFTRVLERADEQLAKAFVHTALNKCSHISDIELYRDIFYILENLRSYNSSIGYIGDLYNYILRTIYDRSSDLIRVHLFKDEFVNKIKLDDALRNISILTPQDCERAVQVMNVPDCQVFIENLFKSTLKENQYPEFEGIINTFRIGSKNPQLIEFTVSLINKYVPDAMLSQLIKSARQYHVTFDGFFSTLLTYLYQRGYKVEPALAAELIFKAILVKPVKVAEIVPALIKDNCDFNFFLRTVNDLLDLGLCRIKSGKYKGHTIYEISTGNRSYIHRNRFKRQDLIDGNSPLKDETFDRITEITSKILSFIESSLVPIIKKQAIVAEEDISLINQPIQTFNSIQNQLAGIRSAQVRILPELRTSLRDHLNGCLSTISSALDNPSDLSRVMQIESSIRSLVESLPELGEVNEFHTLHELASTLQTKLSGIIIHAFKDEFKVKSSTFGSFIEYLELLRIMLQDDRFSSVVKEADLQEWFLNFCNKVIKTDLLEFGKIRKYSDWVAVRQEVNLVRSILRGMPGFDQSCLYVKELENLRDDALENFLEKSSLRIDNDLRYSSVLTLFDELNCSCDTVRANKITQAIYFKASEEYCLKFWLYGHVDIFDFERYAMVYFTLTREERRTFNKRVREIIKVDLDKQLLAVRAPWKLVRKEGNETVYEATWKCVWFHDGAIRFCMDEGIFSAPYKLSYSRKDFNSLYSFLSGKRGGDLTVYCLNNTIVDVQGLDELKELIQRVIITRGLTESDNFLFKSEGENRVPVNLLLKNECINVLSKLVGEGIKVHRVYEKIWKFEHGIQLPFDFDISYIFPVLTSDGRYILFWESARLEKSKATYVFSCPQDQLDEHLERIISFIDKQVNVRSAILTSTEVQSDLGFIGRIEHENFDIFPWKKRLVSYLPGYSDKIFESTETAHQ